jgi:hypothetical protein
MTTISANIGGSAGGVAPGGQPEHWRQQQFAPRSAVDWNEPRYATPRPASSAVVGRRVQPVADVPQLPERNIRVKSRAPAMYYTQEGQPIPQEQFVSVPISPSIIQAIKDGDLERGADSIDEPQHHQREHRHRPKPDSASAQT